MSNDGVGRIVRKMKMGNLVRSLLKFCFASVLIAPILAKWSLDRRTLPLSWNSIPLYFRIHVRSFRLLRTFPRLVKPHNLNDRINWVKLFDQHKLMPILSDKLALKAYVSHAVGQSFCPRTLAEGTSVTQLPFDRICPPFMLKTNHDSGPNTLVRQKSDLTPELLAAVEARLNHKYGIQSGEWPYSKISPKVYLEEVVGGSGAELATDYKFHCVAGEVRFVQVITERGTRAREALVDVNGVNLGYRLDLSFDELSNVQLPIGWPLAVEIAAKLSAPFKYARVDAFVFGRQVWIGEITFFPKGGYYKSGDLRTLGDAINFDTATFLVEP